MHLEIEYVNVSELNVGKTIAEDIFSKTSYPIVNKDTQVSYEHLHIFEVFNITKVPVYKDGIVLKQMDDVEVEIVDDVVEHPTFKLKYDNAIQLFKKEFNNWQAGAKVEFANIRKILLPLVDDVLEDRNIIFELNHYSNPKEYLYHHCISTGLICGIISQKMGFEKGDVLQMVFAGCLADSGMSKISKRILEKKGLLNEFEFNEIKNHPTYSFQLVKDLTALKNEMKIAIYQHHERLDGSGYPLGNKIKDKITLSSQIIAVSDTFHAMTSERMYRSKESPFKVVEMIKEEEFGKFNIRVVDALTSIIADLPIGTKVELSNFERGEIVFVNHFSPTRPLIKLDDSNELIDLSQNRAFYISRVLHDDELFE